MQKILIFTDLDGSLLHRDTFKFEEIKDYIKQLITKCIFIIPNTSKTEREILEFNPKKLVLLERNEHSLYHLINQIGKFHRQLMLY